MALNIFKNRYAPEGNVISDSRFYAVMGATLLFGFFVNVLEVTFLYDFFLSWNVVVFFIAYFICTIAGIIINVVSKRPWLSFIGYCMVILPLGAMLTIILPAFAPTTVRSAFIVTCLIAAVFTLLAIIYPRIFNSIFMVVSISLFVALIYQLFAWLLGFYGFAGIIDWLIVALFACYVGIDVSFAKKRVKTLDNAIDSACGLYLDLINLFVRLLIIFSNSDRR